MIIPNWARAVLALILAAMVAISAYAWFNLPDGAYPVHWGLDGQPDRFGDKWEVVWLLPGIFVATLALVVFLAHADPRRANIEESRPLVPWIWVSLGLMLLVVHGAALAVAFGHDVPITRVVAVAVGLFFVLIGNFLAKSRSNFVIGIRTPWTLSSDEVWRRTHRVGGALFVLTGALTVVAALVLPDAYVILFILGGTVTTAAITFFYSWWLYRKEQAGGQ